MNTAHYSSRTSLRGVWSLSFLPKASFVFLISCFLLLITSSRVSADWTYDKDVPNLPATGSDVFIQVDCGGDGTWDLNGTAVGGNMGECNADTAKVRFVCLDYPTVGGAGCKYVTYELYNGNSGNYDQDVKPTGNWAEESGLTSPATHELPSTITAASTKNQNYTYKIRTAVMTDWAGNSYGITAEAYFVFTPCTIALTPNISIFEGSTGTAFATLTDGSLDSVGFVSSNTNIFTVDPASDSSSTYQTTITAVQDGTATLTATGVIKGVSRCTDAQTVTISQVVPWWQVVDSDVNSNGSLRTTIPNTCALNSGSTGCSPYFGLKGLGGFPGIPAYVSSIDLGQATSVSEEGWVVKNPSSISMIKYKYDYFANIVPAEVFSDANAVLTGDTITQAGLLAGYQSNNAYYHSRAGNLTISGDVDLGDQKTVIFVAGDLYINGKINLNDGRGFFAAFATGSIYVNGAVTNGNNSALEGLYLANGKFQTGVSSNKLVVRGSVAAFGGFELDRDLASGNDSNPSEVFQFAPDLIFTMPKDLMRYNPQWEEIAF